MCTVPTSNSQNACVKRLVYVVAPLPIKTSRRLREVARFMNAICVRSTWPRNSSRAHSMHAVHNVSGVQHEWQAYACH
jgi:hypothetical protein